MIEDAAIAPLKRPVLLLVKSGAFKHTGGYALYGNPPRWHKLHEHKAAPKGAPIAHDPQSVSASPFAMPVDQVAQLKLPDSNTNAATFNKQIDKLVALAADGNAAAILGSKFGVNTYAVKASKVANFLLEKMGVAHKVAHGQDAGSHPAVQPSAPSAVPQGGGKPTEEGHAEGDKWVMPLDAAIQEHKDLVHVAETPSKADDKEQLAEQKAELGKMQEAKGAPSAGPLQMPAFEEGKTVTGVVDYYAKVAQKIIDHGHAGNASVLEAMKEEGLKPNAKGKISNTWSGKTANSKKLLALYDASMAHATGGSAPAPAPAPAAESVIDQLAKIGQAKAEKQAAAIAAVEKLGYGVQKSYTKGLLLSGNKGGMAKTYANQTQAAAAAQKLVDAGIDAAVIGLHPYFVSIKGVLPGAKEGDTKPAADGGTLVLKDGHWVKQGGDAAAAWDAMTTDQKAAILATTSPLYTTSYTGKPNAKAKELAAAGWDALTDAVKAKAAQLVSMYAKQNAAEKPAPVMPEKPVYAEPEADKDQSALKTIGGITFEAVKSGSAWKVKVAGADNLVDGVHADSKGGLWAKLSQHHGSVGGDTFASEFGGKTQSAVNATQLANLQSIPWYKLKLPDTNTNAKSHNAAVAKIEAMAFAGDKAGLQAFIDAKAGAKQTYAKKQALLAQTALAGLQVPGATAAVPVEPEPAVLQGPTASTPVPKDVKATIDGMAAKGDKGALQAVAANNPNNPHVAAYAQDAFEKLQTAEHAVAPGTLPSGPFSATLYHGTSYEFEKYEDEHAGKTTDSGFYGVGMSMSPYKKVAEAYAKHSSSKNSKPPIVLTKDVHLKKPLYTIQGAWTFSDAIHAAIGKKLHDSQEITDALKQAGYDGIVVYLGDGRLNEVTVFSDKKVESKPDDGPKEGDTKPGANGGTLVFKDGRWRKVGWDISVASGDELSDFPDPDPSLGFATMKMLEKMAASGHVSDLQLIIANGGKEPGAVAYAKALLSKVNAEIAKVSPGQSQAMVSPPVAADAPLEGKQKAAIDSLSQDELQALQGSEELPANVVVYINKKLAASAPSKVIASAKLYSNTLDGHNKFWAVSVHGSTLKTTYGKNGTKGQETVKHFPSEAAAKAAAEKLKSEKKGKGYEFVGYTDHEHDAATAPAVAPAAAPAPGPKAISAFEANALKASIAGYSNTIYQNTLKPAAVAGDANAIKQWKAENVGKYPNTHKLADKLLEAMGADGPQEGDTKQGADGMLVLKDGHWVKVGQGQGGGGGSQYSASDVGPDGTPSMDNWVQTGGQGGSNPGGKFKDPTGQEWYCKWPSDPEAIKSEVLAAKLYALAGLSAQDCMVVTKGGKPAIATKWVEIKKAGTAAALAKVPGALEGFAVDAWLGNWDVVGLSLDNLQIGPDGKAHRVDAGGSLEYRAQGEKKPFGAKVDEIDTLRDAAKNSKAAAVFGKMTEADITASVAKVLAIDDAAIRAMVTEHGPGDEAARKALADTLIARKADLFKRYPKAAKPGAKKALDRSALPIDPNTIPKPHDFENWNGPGKGLSSKAAINQANAADEYVMQALAQAGNLTALRTFQFMQVNKGTGTPTGAKLPISQHPSKYVVQYHSDLVQLLEEVANPPEPLKVFRTTDVGTEAGLSAAFPPKPFGTTVSKVSSNEKLGFWVVLGAITGVAKFAPKATHNYSTAAIHAAKEKYKTASALAKHFISSVQASGSYNDLFRDGKTTDSAGNKLTDVAKAALAHATEMPEGTSLYRWQKMSPQMLAHIMSAKEGTVFQATGPMCTSYSPTATKNFGTHRVKIRYAKGAKAVESFASGGFASEKEVTTLPNARFVILSKQMVPDVEHGNPGAQRLELEILMLPPDLGIKE